MKKKKVIIFTGGTGRFASEFKKIKNNFRVYYPSKSKVDILKLHSIIKFIKEKKPNYFIHCAGLSRPMSVHDKEINKSIQVLLSMLKPTSIIAIIITCGQRCQTHSLQGTRS